MKGQSDALFCDEPTAEVGRNNWRRAMIQERLDGLRRVDEKIWELVRKDVGVVEAMRQVGL